MMRQGTSFFRALYARRTSQTTATGFCRMKGDDGSSLVEFALIFLVMMAMMLGIIDFCRAAYAYHFVSNAAREATRWATVNGASCSGDSSCNGTAPMNNGTASDTDIQTYVTNLTPPGIDSSKITTTATWPVQANGPTVCSTTAKSPGCTVKVTVSYAFSFIFPLVYKAFSSTGTLTLASSSEMIIVH